VLLFVDMQAHTHCSSGALAQLHVCSTRRADFAYSSPPSLASANRRMFAPCEESDSRRGADFEGERDQTWCYCSTFVPWDVCSTRHPDFVFRRCLRGLQKRGGSFFAHADGQTSACSCFVSVRGLTSRVSGLYTVCLLLPRLQRRVGSFSPHAWSLTPAGCFLLGDRRVCSTRSAVLSPCRVSRFRRYI
jgi:hypothetical protein